MDAIIGAARQDQRIVLVSADSVLASRALPFLEEFPERLFEVGIAEQDAVDVAAGLATTGLVPIVITYAGFLTMRALEMIRTFIAYPGLNVKLIGLNGGMLGGEREGVTHQFYEDVGIMRAVPGVTVLTPADAGQVSQAVRHMLSVRGPVYLRLASGREPVVYSEDTLYPAGKIRVVRDYGTDVALFASGFVMDRAIAATERLHAEGVYATLVDVSQVKPLDEAGVTDILERCKAAVTVEDHNVIGGLGSAICETACALRPCRVIRLGLQDTYARSGKADELLDLYGLSVAHIVETARSLAAERKTSGGNA